MPLTRRYTPEHPPGETCAFGLDYAFIIPQGVGIDHGTLSIVTNTVAPVDATADWTIGPVQVRDRAIYATLSGGIAGKDYLLRWTAYDTAGNVWPRTAMILCAADTS